MVKWLDGKTEPWPDHLGWRLWQANRRWQDEFVAGMQHAGHDWFTRARAALLAHVGRDGIRQSVLVERCGTTKQAVQQLIDGLEKEGVLERQVDGADSRSRIVVQTAKGLSAIRDGNRIKQAIDDRWERELGPETFERLMLALARVAEPDSSRDLA